MWAFNVLSIHTSKKINFFTLYFLFSILLHVNQVKCAGILKRLENKLLIGKTLENIES